MNSIARSPKSLALAITLIIATQASPLQAQDGPTTGDDSTVTYPAEYFAQFSPFSASDMLDRIAGINVARQGGGGGGGPGSSNGSDRRGLGLGGDQILINGRRITGKSNEGNSQLSRIPANQVQYIEIIRGTSGDLDVRGGTQVINIVLLEAETRSSIAYEINSDHLHDGKLKPGGKISLTGSSGALEYLLSAETEPRWEWRVGSEESVLGDGSPNDSINRRTLTDSQPLILSTNLGYQFNEQNIAHFNAQYENRDAPSVEDRFITNYQASPVSSRAEADVFENSSDFWEIGGDYEYTLGNGDRWKTLIIANRKEDSNDRDRLLIGATQTTNDLFLATFNRYQERIMRSSYSIGLSDSQDLEFGMESAQTTLDSALRLGLLPATGDNSGAFGGLTPITDSDATVEEIRYEGFAVHNWQLNTRMSLESTLIFEKTEISQSGDVSKSRNFSFVRPKVDYRFDLTPSLQLRATIEKDVAQLSFNDFTANVDSNDNDQNEVAGNPDLRQEQSWRYALNLEYRFDNDNAVLNTNFYYHDLEDVIDRIDASSATEIQSANGNIGNGERYGIAVDASLRLASFNLPNLLVTSRVEVEDSNVTDPFLGIERRLNRQGRGSYRLGFRHDLTGRNMNYGVDYNENLEGSRVYDIDKIEAYDADGFIRAFVELQGWAGLTYRFEATNFQESWRCRTRSRYSGGTLATGSLSEIEQSCSHAGEKYAIKIRGTF
jgi:outer membrane receptor for ferrienterochelin and colicins